MHRFKIALLSEIDADSPKEAAMLAYQQLTASNAQIQYLVTDETGETTSVSLDRSKADEFSKEDHTADPGNW